MVTPARKDKTTTAGLTIDFALGQQIKELLKNDVRNLALLSLAFNSAFRVGDLCNLTGNDTLNEGTTITPRVFKEKTKRPRIVPVNAQSSAFLRDWRRYYESEYNTGAL